MWPCPLLLKAATMYIVDSHTASTFLIALFSNFESKSFLKIQIWKRIVRLTFENYSYNF